MPTEIQLAFLPVDSEAAAEAWQNHAASLFTGSKYIHCELLFPKTDEAFSITADSHVFLYRGKRFSRSEWDFFSVAVQPHKYAAMYAFARAQVGKPFNTWGFYTSVLGGFWGDGAKESYFCSELITHALQAGGMLSEYTPHRMTPGSLATALEGHTSRTMHPRADMGQLVQSMQF